MLASATGSRDLAVFSSSSSLFLADGSLSSFVQVLLTILIVAVARCIASCIIKGYGYEAKESQVVRISVIVSVIMVVLGAGELSH